MPDWSDPLEISKDASEFVCLRFFLMSPPRLLPSCFQCPFLIYTTATGASLTLCSDTSKALPGDVGFGHLGGGGTTLV